MQATCKRCATALLYPNPSDAGNGWCGTCFKPHRSGKRLVGAEGVLTGGKKEHFYSAEACVSRRGYTYLEDEDHEQQWKRAQTEHTEPTQPRHLGFIAQENRRLRFFMDIDGKTTSTTKEELYEETKQAALTIIEAIVQASEELFEKTLSDEDFYVSYEASTSANKLSFHLFCTKLIFFNLNELKAFVSKVVEDYQLQHVDKSVYSRNRILMAPFNSKPLREQKELLPLHETHTPRGLIQAAQPHCPAYDSLQESLRIKTKKNKKKKSKGDPKEVKQALNAECFPFVQSIKITGDTAYILFKPDHPCPVVGSAAMHHGNNAVYNLTTKELTCFGSSCKNIDHQAEEDDIDVPLPTLPPGTTPEEKAILDKHTLRHLNQQNIKTFEKSKQAFQMAPEYKALSHALRAFGSRKQADLTMLDTIIKDYDKVVESYFHHCTKATAGGDFTAVYAEPGQWKLLPNMRSNNMHTLHYPYVQPAGTLGIKELTVQEIATRLFYQDAVHADYYFNNNHPENSINLFTGWAVTAEDALWYFHQDLGGDFDKLREVLSAYNSTIHEIACNRDEQNTKYMHAWFYNIYCLGLKTETVPCLYGKSGAGKTSICAMWSKLLGEKYTVKISSQEELTGHFNHHLRGKILIMNEEASWGGTKRDAGATKDIITSTRILINKKMEPVRQERNNLNMMITSNNLECFPYTTAGDRRWCLLSVNNKYSGLKQSQASKAHFQRFYRTPLAAISYFYYFMVRETALEVDLRSDFRHDTSFPSLFIQLLIKGANGFVRMLYDTLSECEDAQDWKEYHSYTARNWFTKFPQGNYKRVPFREAKRLVENLLMWDITKQCVDIDATLQEQQEHFASKLSNN